MPSAPIFASRRVRSTPFTERVEAAGVSAYTTYNHMLLPAAFKSLEDDYHHLKRHVQIWDVSVERQVELKGPDAHKLAIMMSARDLTNAKPGRGYYAPLCDGNGGLINDPVALCLSLDHWWISIADSDVLLWALGLAQGYGLNVEITEPDVSPLAIQGPKAEDLVAEVFGEQIRDIGFFRFEEVDFHGTPMILQRSGYSKQGGFEIYLPRFELGNLLWDTFWEAGHNKTYQLEPGCPNLIERIEGGLLSYGNDMTRENTPLECGLGNYISLDKDVKFIGKEALLRQRAEGVKQQLVGLMIDGDPIRPLAFPFDCQVDGASMGIATSACYSPDYASNIGMGFIATEHSELGSEMTVIAPEGELTARVVPLPFEPSYAPDTSAIAAQAGMAAG